MKKYIIIGLIVLIYVIVMLFCFGFIGGQKYLIIGSQVKWIYKNNKWENVEIVKPIKARNIDVYNFSTRDYLGKYTITLEDGNISIPGDVYEENNTQILAYGGKREDFRLIKFSNNYVVDQEEISRVLREEGISSKGPVSANKITVDLDNDGDAEDIYVLYNALMYDDDIEIYYSLVYLKDGNQYSKIALKKSTEPFYDRYEILSILDFTNDGIYEIILSKSGIDFDGNDTSYSMYELENGKYNLIATTIKEA